MPRPIFVALLPRLLQATRVENLSVALVIDTLRFTTTACQALEAGAASVTVASSVNEARQLSHARPPGSLLCGERDCHPIEGFDLGNSPYEYKSTRVKDRSLIFTTTNGTVAVAAVRQVATIVLAALVNRHAVCRQLRETLDGDLAIVCAGTDGDVALEDVLTAGAIIGSLVSETSDTKIPFACGNDAALLALGAWNEVTARRASARGIEEQICERMLQAIGGRNLLEAGYERDVRFASRLDVLDVVPQANNNDQSFFNKWLPNSSG